MGWRDRALCKGSAADGFLYWISGKRADKEIAKSICADCPVSKECYAEGKRNNDTRVIRGGVEL